MSNWEHVENQLANLFVAFIGGKVSRDKPSPSVRAYQSTNLPYTNEQIPELPRPVHYGPVVGLADLLIPLT